MLEIVTRNQFKPVSLELEKVKRGHSLAETATKISLITVCYNRKNTIRKAIESVLSQDYSNIEYIVVDGASTDSTLSVVNEYKNQISKIISEPDNGMYEAINKGIKACTGDIIGLVHSDDFLYSCNTISKIATAMQLSNCDLLYGNGSFFKPDQPEKTVRTWIGGPYSKNKVKWGWLPLHPTVYIRKKCFERLGLYDESYQIAGDSELLVRYFYRGNLKVFYLNDYIINVSMGGKSTCLKSKGKTWAEDLRHYRNQGFCAPIALACKILRKVPQYLIN